GSIEFEDNKGGGTLVRLVFDAETLARLGGGAAELNTGKAANG
ncbi:MAG: hypothetical protein QOJ94_3128, partial [Sphingomonadales bacterium]|nr:hypothetical protein [Sphingomonadales bacterium]